MLLNIKDVGYWDTDLQMYEQNQDVLSYINTFIQNNEKIVISEEFCGVNPTTGNIYRPLVIEWSDILKERIYRELKEYVYESTNTACFALKSYKLEVE